MRSFKATSRRAIGLIEDKWPVKGFVPLGMKQMELSSHSSGRVSFDKQS